MENELKTKLDHINALNELRYKKAEIHDKAEEEKRDMNHREQVSVETIDTQIQEIETRMKSLDETSEKETRGQKIEVGENRSLNNFNLAQSISDYVQGKPVAEATQEMNKRGYASFEGTGIQTRGQFIIPVNASNIEKRSEIVAGTDTQGKEIVLEDSLGLIAGLRERSVLTQAGAVMYTGLKNNLTLNKYAGSSVNWEGETDESADGGNTFSDLVWKPHRISGYIDISKQFLIQDTQNAQQILKNDLMEAVLNKLEDTALGDVSGATDMRPAGLLHNVAHTVSGTSALTYSNVVALEGAVATNKALKGSLSYITTPTLRSNLKTTQKASNSGVFIVNDAKIDDYPLYATTAVADKSLIFGNWSDFVIAQFGGLDILPDIYSQAGKGKVRIHINAYFDFKRRRDESFAYASIT